MHDKWIIRVRRVDDRIDALCDLDKWRIGVKIAAQRLDVALLQPGRRLVRARKPDDLVAAFEQFRRDRSADVAGRARNEDLHRQSSGLSGSDLPSGTGTSA